MPLSCATEAMPGFTTSASPPADHECWNTRTGRVAGEALRRSTAMFIIPIVPRRYTMSPLMKRSTCFMKLSSRNSSTLIPSRSKYDPLSVRALRPFALMATRSAPQAMSGTRMIFPEAYSPGVTASFASSFFPQKVTASASAASTPAASSVFRIDRFIRFLPCSLMSIAPPRAPSAAPLTAAARRRIPYETNPDAGG